MRINGVRDTTAASTGEHWAPRSFDENGAYLIDDYLIEGERDTVDVGVSSDYTQEHPQNGGDAYYPNAIPGDDRNDGITNGSNMWWQRPMRTAQAAIKRYRDCRDGLHVRIHLAGGGGPQNGFLGPCNAVLSYYNQYWPVTGNNNRSGLSYWGPPGKFVHANLGSPLGSVIDGSAYPAAYTVVQFAPASFTTDQHAIITMRLRTVRSNGSLRHFDIPVFRNDTANIYIPDQGALAGAIVDTDTIQIVRNAVQLVTDGDNEIRIEGSGPLRAGIKGSGHEPNSERYLNPEPDFYCIDFAGAHVLADFVWLAECSSDDHDLVVKGKHCKLSNFRCDHNVFVIGGSIGGLFSVQNQVEGASAENASYAHPDFTPLSKKQGIDLHMGRRAVGIAGGSIYIGSKGPNATDRNLHGGQAVFHRGFSSMACGGDAALYVAGNSVVHMHRSTATGGGASALIYGATHGIHAKDSAHLNLNKDGIRIDAMQGGARDLAVGDAATDDGATLNPIKSMTLAAFKARPHLCNLTPAVAQDTFGTHAAVESSGCPAVIRG